MDPNRCQSRMAAQPLSALVALRSAVRDGDGAALMTTHGWTAPWAWGVFEYHHYHSSAWCVPGVRGVRALYICPAPGARCWQPAAGHRYALRR